MQRRLARRFVLANCFYDGKLQEGINLKTSKEISAHLSRVCQAAVQQEIPSSFVRGEVLFDGYGRGSLQL